MYGKTWRTFEYDIGYIESKWVVLVRGGDFYPSYLTSWPWKIYATVVDGDSARKIVKGFQLVDSLPVERGGVGFQACQTTP